MEGERKGWIMWKDGTGGHVVVYGRIVGQHRGLDERDFVALHFDDSEDIPPFVRGQTVWYLAFKVKKAVTPQEYFASKLWKRKHEQQKPLETAAEYNERRGSGKQRWLRNEGNRRFCLSCSREAHLKPAETCASLKHSEYYERLKAAKRKPEGI
jgi:hypothetical protein